MDSNDIGTRRKFLTKICQTGYVLTTGGWLLQSCGQAGKSQDVQQTAYEGDPCEDLRSVSEAELAKRENFGYVAESPIPDNVCQNCNLYLPPKGESPCGKCILFKGPVQSEGYCTYWALKA